MGAIAKNYAAELEGIHAKLIEVETDLNVGLHAFTIVGLADKALSEAKERVNSAIKNSGAKPPNRENRKITINLAPADIKKTGSQYDIAIALGYLSATGQIKKIDMSKSLFVGELALDGSIRSTTGILSIAQMACEKKFEAIFVPEENMREAGIIKNISVYGVKNLRELIDHLEGKKMIEKYNQESVGDNDERKEKSTAPDISEIIGQHHAKRALTVAAAGGHNILMIGPPGVGKSMLAHALIEILPSLSDTEAIEVTKIWSIAGIPSERGLRRKRPFRTPHHTASQIAVIGGGTNPKPGEISLAHKGVLFLDELPEFQKATLESLRQPLESGIVHIARAKGTLAFPAEFCLVAAANPCPCGYYGDEQKECVCTQSEIIRYRKKMSGPLLDRIDLQVRVNRVSIDALQKIETTNNKESREVKKLIEEARLIQKERFTKHNIPIDTNAQMSSKQTREISCVDKTGEKFLGQLQNHNLSARSYYRLIKTARTIADIEKSEVVNKNHLAEAFSYKLKE
jgi:magnesium chelatase family protein